MTQQRLSDLKTEFEMASDLAAQVEVENDAAWQEFERLLDEFRSLRSTLGDVDALMDDDDVDSRLVERALATARERMEAAHHARLLASSRLVLARKRRDGLRTTLRAAEYLAEREVQR
jgi:hypothetical protein